MTTGAATAMVYPDSDGMPLPDGELRFWDPASGRWLLTQEEEQEGRLEAEARASTAEARVAELEAELK